MLEILRRDLKQAMKDKDVTAKIVIQGIISAADEARIKAKHELTDAEIITVIRKENNNYSEMLAGAISYGRYDIIAETKKKIAIAGSYIPKGPSEEDLNTLAKCAVIAQGLDTSNKSVMMKALMPILKEVADGQTASRIISNLVTK